MIIRAHINLLSAKEGGRKGFIVSQYRPSFRLENGNSDCVLTFEGEMQPGEQGEVEINILHVHLLPELKEGMEFSLTEGRREVANGTIIKL